MQNGMIISNTARFAVMRSLGSHKIATGLRQHGWNIEVIDFGDYWTVDELKQLVKQRMTPNMKFIGFSYIYSYTDTHCTVKALAEWVRETYPDVLLIGGGQMPSNCQCYLDYFISGYGEVAIEKLLKYKFGNGDEPKWSMYGVTKVIDATHDYPAYPDRESMVLYEDRDFIVPGEWGQIEFSRGCKFACKFCSYPILGVNYDSTRTAESAHRQMLDAYDRYGIEDYLIVDETFNDRTEKITKFADMVETLPWKPYFAGAIRADLLISRPKDRDELLRMGVLGHYHGIESFNPAASKFIGKGMAPEKIQEGLLDVSQFFSSRVGRRYRPVINFIAGLPHETLDSLEQTYQWLKNVWYPRHSSATVLELNNEHSQYNKSFISENSSKLGYQPIVLHINKGSFPQHVDENDRLMWKSPHMDITDAISWCLRVDSIHTLAGKSMRYLEPSDFTVPMCRSDGTLLTLDEKLVLTEYTATPYTANAETVFVEQYKTRKLDL